MEKLRNFTVEDLRHQLFADAAEVVRGSRIVFLYRVLEEQASTTGTTLAFTTENNLSISKDADSTATKDGAIRTPNEAEIEAGATSIFKKGDLLIGKLKTAMLGGKLIEVWRANLDDPVSTAEGNQKFYGTYYQGYLTSFEETSNAEDYVEFSLTFGINGNGVDGAVTVTTQQQEEAQYQFVDTTVQTQGA